MESPASPPSRVEHSQGQCWQRQGGAWNPRTLCRLLRHHSPSGARDPGSLPRPVERWVVLWVCSPLNLVHASCSPQPSRARRSHRLAGLQGLASVSAEASPDGPRVTAGPSPEPSAPCALQPSVWTWCSSDVWFALWPPDWPCLSKKTFLWELRELRGSGGRGLVSSVPCRVFHSDMETRGMGQGAGLHCISEITQGSWE